MIRQLDITWALLEYHAEGLDDATCLWEPAPHCWSVRPDDRGRWVADWADAEPDPVPAVTIAWVTWHIGFWWTTTLGHCFGDGAPAREEITWPGGAGPMIDWLRGLNGQWRARLLELSDADLDSTARTAGLPWGEGLTLGNVAAWVGVELTKNVAEVGIVRNLHLARGHRPPTG